MDKQLPLLFSTSTVLGAVDELAAASSDLYSVVSAPQSI